MYGRIGKFFFAAISTAIDTCCNRNHSNDMNTSMTSDSFSRFDNIILIQIQI